MAVATFDASARKFHQWSVVALLVIAYAVDLSIGIWLVALAGVVMLVGRFWWPADIFRQLAWRVLEPAGVLPRRDVVEDHATRRVARALGGGVFLVSAGLLAAGQPWAWGLVAAIAVMITLDAAFDFCVLCELNYRYAKLRGGAA